MRPLTMIFVLITLTSGCNTISQHGGMLNIHKLYAAGDYVEMFKTIQFVQSTRNINRELAAELLFFKAQGLDRVERAHEAVVLYEILIEEYGDTQYGYQAREILNSGSESGSN